MYATIAHIPVTACMNPNASNTIPSTTRIAWSAPPTFLVMTVILSPGQFLMRLAPLAPVLVLHPNECKRRETVTGNFGAPGGDVGQRVSTDKSAQSIEKESVTGRR
jgi:hypothetical protein